MLAGSDLWERENSEAVELWIDSSLFADDTSVVGEEDEIEDGVRITKKVMGDFEERNKMGFEVTVIIWR